MAYDMRQWISLVFLVVFIGAIVVSQIVIQRVKARRERAQVEAPAAPQPAKAAGLQSKQEGSADKAA